MVVIALIFNPLIRTPEGIRRHLLRTTPIGTSMEDVVLIADEISNSSCPNRIRIRDHGVVLHPRDPLRPTNFLPADLIGSTVSGDQSVRIHLGHYRIIFRIDVVAFYAFDEDGKLIEIFISKEWDLL